MDTVNHMAMLPSVKNILLPGLLEVRSSLVTLHTLTAALKIVDQTEPSELCQTYSARQRCSPDHIYEPPEIQNPKITAFSFKSEEAKSLCQGATIDNRSTRGAFCYS